jgi:hypothetical protein
VDATGTARERNLRDRVARSLEREPEGGNRAPEQSQRGDAEGRTEVKDARVVRHDRGRVFSKSGERAKVERDDTLVVRELALELPFSRRQRVTGLEPPFRSNRRRPGP